MGVGQGSGHRNTKTPCSGALVYRLGCPHGGAGVKDLKGDALLQSLLGSRPNDMSLTAKSTQYVHRTERDGRRETEEEWRTIPKRAYLLKQESAGF